MEKTITTRGHPVFQQAPAFTLEDQFREVHTLSFPRARPCVILFADREGSKQIERWLASLYQRYKNALDVCEAALLDRVPDTLRPTVRFFFKQKADHPILMDWDGAVARKFSCRPKEANVFVVDRNGAIVYTVHGEADPSRLSEVCQAADQLLEPASAAAE